MVTSLGHEHVREPVTFADRGRKRNDAEDAEDKDGHDAAVHSQERRMPAAMEVPLKGPLSPNMTQVCSNVHLKFTRALCIHANRNIIPNSPITAGREIVQMKVKFAHEIM